jgi:hypothetical protein
MEEKIIQIKIELQMLSENLQKLRREIIELLKSLKT